MQQAKQLNFYKNNLKKINMKTGTSSLMDGTNTLNKLTEEHNERVQKLIDKDIFEQATVAMEEHYGYDCETEIDAYFRGAKWMQKQFKQQEL
jgi:uncharacterized protein with ParB-like and HNH nuclease domain